MAHRETGRNDPMAPVHERRARFTRTDFERGPRQLVSRGRWANAIVYRYEQGGVCWLVKDFRERPWLVRNLVGRFLVRRECRSLARVDGLPLMPRDSFRLDAHALAYRFVPGRSLRGKPPIVPPPDYFPALERALVQMHQRARIVHLDLRNAGNILVTDAGQPMPIDFQSAVGTRWMPGPLRRFAEQIDFAAIYKHWRKRSPGTLGAERLAALSYINRLRPLWVPRGYAGVPRQDRPDD